MAPEAADVPLLLTGNFDQTPVLLFGHWSPPARSLPHGCCTINKAASHRSTVAHRRVEAMVASRSSQRHWPIGFTHPGFFLMKLSHPIQSVPPNWLYETGFPMVPDPEHHSSVTEAPRSSGKRSWNQQIENVGAGKSPSLLLAPRGARICCRSESSCLVHLRELQVRHKTPGLTCAMLQSAHCACTSYPSLRFAETACENHIRVISIYARLLSSEPCVASAQPSLLARREPTTSSNQ